MLTIFKLRDKIKCNFIYLHPIKTTEQYAVYKKIYLGDIIQLRLKSEKGRREVNVIFYCNC